MRSDIFKHYLRDLGGLVVQSAFGALERRDEASGNDRSFAEGRLSAYHEIVDLMQQQAVAFGIGLDEFALDHIDPDRDLL